MPAGVRTHALTAPSPRAKGVVALLAAKIVGPRAGRFHARDQGPNELRGHSSALSVLGTFLLTVGWLGFNLGSIRHITLPGAPQIAAQTAVCTSLSGSAGCLAAISVMRCRYPRSLHAHTPPACLVSSPHGRPNPNPNPNPNPVCELGLRVSCAQAKDRMEPRARVQRLAGRSRLHHSVRLRGRQHDLHRHRCAGWAHLLCRLACGAAGCKRRLGLRRASHAQGAPVIHRRRNTSVWDGTSAWDLLSPEQVVSNVLRVDDVLDAFAVHGACGCWSMLAAGFLANGAAIVEPGPLGIFYGGDGQLIAANLLAVVTISAWALLLGSATLLPLHRAGLMRISAEFETTGIDVSEMGRAAYSSGAEAGGQPVLAASREVFAASDMENMAPDAAPVVAVRVPGATSAGVELVGPQERTMPAADVAEGSLVDGVHGGASQETGRDS